MSPGSGERALIVGTGPGPQETGAALAATADTVLRAGRGGRLAALSGRGSLRQDAAGRSWRVSAGAFWQVHPGAADALTGAVLDVLRPRPGEVALDLFCGAGLFAGALAAAVGPDGMVVAVDTDRAAVRDARHNLRDTPWARVHAADAAAALARGGWPPPALAVLDPPRTGVPRQVIERLLGPRRRGGLGAGRPRQQPAHGGLRVLRPGHPGPRHRRIRPAGLAAGSVARVRHLPDDASRGMRGGTRPAVTKGSRAPHGRRADSEETPSAGAARCTMLVCVRDRAAAGRWPAKQLIRRCPRRAQEEVRRALAAVGPGGRPPPSSCSRSAGLRVHPLRRGPGGRAADPAIRREPVGGASAGGPGPGQRRRAAGRAPGRSPPDPGVGYRVHEVLLGQNNIAVGRTSPITGAWSSSAPP